MHSIIFALIFTSFPLVSGLSAAPSSQPAGSDDDNPYGVEMPKAQDTVKSPPKTQPKAADTLAVKPKVSTPDTASKKVAKKLRAVKDSTALKKKMAVSQDTSKTTIKADTSRIKLARTDSIKAVPKTDTMPPVGAHRDAPLRGDTAASKPAVTDSGARKSRPRLVRETTINTINEMKGRYRSPKKALFMSLVIPGLGQAYIGQSTFNYARAALYFGTDITLGAFWYQYVVVKYNREVRHYQHFADQYWSQSAYEAGIVQQIADSNKFLLSNTSRVTYCSAVQDRTGPGNAIYEGCVDPGSPAYSTFQSQVASNELYSDSIHARRAAYFPDLFQFYALIGQEQEFVKGWQDVQNFFADTVITGTSAERNQYIAMRATANRYSRMQAWFIGGIVINHIASALDAALTATYYNRRLYETESTWYERLHFDGGLAFDQGWPRTSLIASLSF